MSVVVYHDGVMASDSRAFAGDPHPVGNKRKIHRLADGSLLGITSNQVGMPEAFKRWIEEGADRDVVMPASPSLDALHVMPDGRVYLYCDGYTPSGPLEGDVFAVGSAKKYAYGAVMMGASAARAVEVAKECDIWCGGPVRTLKLNEKE